MPQSSYSLNRAYLGEMPEPVSTSSVEWSILCFIEFFPSLCAHLDFKHGKINKSNAPFYAFNGKEPSRTNLLTILYIYEA